MGNHTDRLKDDMFGSHSPHSVTIPPAPTGSKAPKPPSVLPSSQTESVPNLTLSELLPAVV